MGVRGNEEGCLQAEKSKATLAAAILFLLIAGALSGQETSHWVPPRELSMPKDEIWESLLGYLVGLIDADVSFALSGSDLLSVLPEFKARRGDPFELLKEVARRPGAQGHARLSFSFPDALHIPLPVGFLGYQPISVSASQTVVLEEYSFASRSILSAPQVEDVLSPDFEYRLAQGYAQFNFAEWLVYLTGGFLDDFSVKGVAIFRYRGTWHALMAGVSRGGRVVCWLFDLKRMRLVLSIPKPLLELAAELVGAAPAVVS